MTTNNHPQQNTLDNLLDELIHSINNNPETSNYVGAEDDKALARLRASLIDYIDKEIIGENDRPKIRYYDEIEQANVYYADEAGSVRMTRNNLRAEQRAKLKGKE